jgi:hypothetical protein
MASTLTTAQKRCASRAAAPQTPKQALTTLACDAVHIQIAAWTGAANALARWAQSTDQFARAVADELLAAADHFDMRLARLSIDHKESR